MSERVKREYTCVYCGKKDWHWASRDSAVTNPKVTEHNACRNLNGYLKVLLKERKADKEARVADMVRLIRDVFPDYGKWQTASTKQGRELKRRLKEAEPLLKK